MIDRGIKYGKNVISGKIPACKWVRLSAQRHFNDLEKWKKKGSEFYFDKVAAEKIVRFFSIVKHSKGALAGKNFILSDWQVFWVSVIFGWKRKNGLRRFQTVYFGVPRKNGKTTFVAPIGIYMMLMDKEEGAEIYSAATKRDQSKLIFEEAQRMVRGSDDLSKMIQVYKHSLYIEGTATKFEALSSDAKSLDGLNPHCVLIDELHAHKTPDLYGVLDTAIGARKQPIMFSITTAGFRNVGICVDQRDYGRSVVQNTIKDDSYFFVDYGVDEGDDPFSEETWKKANPNYGISIEPETFSRLAVKAENQTSFLNEFLTKHLNVWTSSEEAFFDMKKWEKCEMSYDWDTFKKCNNIHAGLDLSSTQDLTALVFIGELDGKILTYSKFYLPKENILEKQRNDHVSYVAWSKDDYITLTAGDVVDYKYIERDIKKMSEEIEIQELVFDQWNSSQVIVNLQEDTNIECVKFPQTIKFFSPVLKDLEVFINRQEIAHNKHPILSWNISNMTVIRDVNGNMRPDKSTNTQKIDGVVALLMALSRFIANTSSEVQAAEDGTFF